MTDFCKRFNTAFSESGLSQAELARRSNLTRMEVNNYLKGKYKPKEKKMLALAKALHVNPDWLAGADVSRDGTQDIDFLTNENIYLDDKPLTDFERKQMAVLARSLRTTKPTNK